MTDARIAETFWTGETGRALRSHPADVRELAVLLMSGPGKNLYGLYYKSIQSMIHETGRTEKSLRHALAVLDDLCFACFDAENEYVWVIEMAAYQFRPLPLHAGDFRVTNANRWYQNCPKNIFLGAFFDRYGDGLKLVGPRRVWAPAELLIVEAPFKPLAQIGSGSDPQNEIVLFEGARFSVADGFEAFWGAYPRAVGKLAAKQEYYKRKPNAALHAKIMSALAAQSRSARWLEEAGRYIPNPSTWLHQGRWEDRPCNIPHLSKDTIASLDAGRRFAAAGERKESP